MQLSAYHYYLLSLLKDYIQNEKSVSKAESNEIKMDREGWQNLYSLSSKHGVTSMALQMLQVSENASQLELLFIPESNLEANEDALNESSLLMKYGLIDIKTNTPPADLFAKWKIDTQESEKIYFKEVEVLKELLDFLKENDIEVLVINGIVSGQMYNHPSHRHYGDIDILIGDDYNKTIKLIGKMGINVDVINQNYSTFKYRGVTVRNHKHLLFYQFRHRLFTKQDRKIEKQLDKLLVLGSDTVIMSDLVVKTPNPEFMMLYYVRHLVLHFLEYGIFLRHLCDFTLFIETNRDYIDFVKMEKIFKKSHMFKLFSSFVSICKTHLGLNLDMDIKEDKKLTERILNDIFFNKYRITERQKLKRMGSFGRYTLRLSYLFSSKWKYDHIQRGLYLRMLPYKLLF